MRGRFAWIGAGAILLAVGGMATAATQDTWLDGYGIIAYGLVPLAFVPLAAGLIASARANRFVECVFTAPVERRDWLIAKLLVLLTLATGYYLALLPMMIVYDAHIGIPFLLQKFLLWTPALLIVSIAIGALIGVLFIGRSLAAPAGAGMGVLLFYAGLMPLQELLVARGNGATRTGHLVLASPAVLLKNALGFTLAVGSIPTTTAATWLSLAIITVGALVLAFWIFLRAQGVETWETTPAQRWIITFGLLALMIVPMTLADTNYDTPAPPANNAPAIRGLFGRSGINLALVSTGHEPPSRCCSPLLNRESSALGTDETSKRDLLLLFPIESSERLSELKIQVQGDANLSVSADDSGDRLETRTYPNESGPMATDGHHIGTGWIARVPVVLRPEKPWDIGGNRYPVSVRASYRVDGEPAPRTFVARAAVEAQVPGAIYEMGAVSLLLPLFCFGAAFRRWRQTR
jgi:ABC-type transport system involved in multi-copper enzyme maturation permease subunit